MNNPANRSPKSPRRSRSLYSADLNMDNRSVAKTSKYARTEYSSTSKQSSKQSSKRHDASFDHVKAAKSFTDFFATISSSSLKKDDVSAIDSHIQEAKKLLPRLSKLRNSQTLNSFWNCFRESKKIIDNGFSSNMETHDISKCIGTLEEAQTGLRSVINRMGSLENESISEMFVTFESVIQDLRDYKGGDISPIIKQVTTLQSAVPTSSANKSVSEALVHLTSYRANLRSSETVNAQFQETVKYYRSILENKSQDDSASIPGSPSQKSQLTDQKSTLSRRSSMSRKSRLSKKTVVEFSPAQKLQIDIKQLEKRVNDTNARADEAQKSLDLIQANHDHERKYLENQRDQMKPQYEETDDPEFLQLQELEDKCYAYRKFIRQKQQELAAKQRILKEKSKSIEKCLALNEQSEYFRESTKEKSERRADVVDDNKQSRNILKGGNFEMSLNNSALKKHISRLEDQIHRISQTITSQQKGREQELDADDPETMAMKLQSESLAIGEWRTRIEKEKAEIDEAVANIPYKGKISPHEAESIRATNIDLAQASDQLRRELDQYNADTCEYAALHVNYDDLATLPRDTAAPNAPQVINKLAGIRQIIAETRELEQRCQALEERVADNDVVDEFQKLYMRTMKHQTNFEEYLVALQPYGTLLNVPDKRDDLPSFLIGLADATNSSRIETFGNDMKSSNPQTENLRKQLAELRDEHQGLLDQFYAHEREF